MHCYSLCNLSMKLMMTWVLSRRNYDDPYCLDHWVVFCAINLRKLPIFMFASQWTTAAGWVITFFSELSTVHFLEENIWYFVVDNNLSICCFSFVNCQVVADNVAVKKLFKCLTAEPHDGAKLKQIFFNSFVITLHNAKQISAIKSWYLVL